MRAANQKRCRWPLHIAGLPHDVAASGQPGCSDDGCVFEATQRPFCHILLVTSESQAHLDSREELNSTFFFFFKLYLLMEEWKDLEEQVE